MGVPGAVVVVVADPHLPGVAVSVERHRGG